ncbi:hypothetical protein [Pararhizobium antarcticum]|uniref:hypothetical protein n=1 Tax=Pararhizobium antarcticum TaxID=1798805 RepID=UPI001114E8FA|nr:hypothetical protein [Pararhizobium antarcticum]
MALTAVCGFWMIRNAAIRSAGDTATAWIEEKGRSLFAEAISVKQGTNQPRFGVSDVEENKAIDEAKEIGGM